MTFNSSEDMIEVEGRGGECQHLLAIRYFLSLLLLLFFIIIFIILSLRKRKRRRRGDDHGDVDLVPTDRHHILFSTHRWVGEWFRRLILLQQQRRRVRRLVILFWFVGCFWTKRYGEGDYHPPSLLVY